MDKLSPSQSADVIKYYHSAENHETRVRGWRDKVPLGRSALHTISPRHSIVPEGKPLLNPVELGEGLEYIESNTYPLVHVSDAIEEQEIPLAKVIEINIPRNADGENEEDIHIRDQDWRERQFKD